MHIVTVSNKKTGEIVYKETFPQLVNAVVDYNKHKRFADPTRFDVNLKSDTTRRYQ